MLDFYFWGCNFLGVTCYPLVRHSFFGKCLFCVDCLLWALYVYFHQEWTVTAAWFTSTARSCCWTCSSCCLRIMTISLSPKSSWEIKARVMTTPFLRFRCQLAAETPSSWVTLLCAILRRTILLPIRYSLHLYYVIPAVIEWYSVELVGLSVSVALILCACRLVSMKPLIYI